MRGSVALPIGDEKTKMVRGMFDRIASRYDLLNLVISLGRDSQWRKRALRELRLSDTRGLLAADLACGTGDFCQLLTDRGIRTLGIDFSMGMLRNAHTTAPLVQADVTQLPLGDACLDIATCGFGMRNFANLDAFFLELARVVRPGGRIALLDAGTPQHAILRAGHALFFGQFVPLFGRIFSDAKAYRYLPKSLAYLPQPNHIIDMLRQADFGAISYTPLLGGAAQLYVAARN